MADATAPRKDFDLRYTVDDKPGATLALLFGLQHVLVMFTAMVAAPLVIAQLLDLPAEVRASMLGGVILGCGIATLVSSLGLGFVGARLPLVFGANALYIGPVVAIAKTSSLAAASTAMLIGGLVLFVLAPVVGRMRALFPPIVVGTTMIVTGITLIRIAAKIASGIDTPYAGRVNTIGFALGSIALIVVINRLTRGSLRTLSVFIAVGCICLIAGYLDLIDLSPVERAKWFALPAISPFGLFVWPETSAIAIIVAYHLFAAIYTASVTLALCNILGVEGSTQRIRGSVAVAGLGSMATVSMGGVPLTPYDQNVGVISLTGVGSRFVVAAAGLLLIVVALLPKVSALITTVPPFVLGGTLIFMFSTICAIGVNILSNTLKSQRNFLILTTSVGLAVAVNFAPAELFAQVPPSLRILASDGILVGTSAAFLLNIILPDDAIEGKDYKAALTKFAASMTTKLNEARQLMSAARKK